MNTAIIKNEVLDNIIDTDIRECCRFAYLSALIRVSACIMIVQRTLSLKMRLSSDKVADLVVTLLSGYDVICDKTSTKNSTYLNISGADVQKLLIDTSILDASSGGERFAMHIDGFLIMDECCKRAFLQGVFLGAGVLITGRNMRYIELSINSQNISSDICTILQTIGIATRLKAKGNKYKIYIYGFDNLIDTLGAIGANKSMFECLHDKAKNAKAQNVNRSVNCINANLDKSVEYNIRTVAICSSVLGSDIYSGLDDRLKATVAVRLDNPEDTLSVLAELLDVSKSCVKNRLSKLEGLLQVQSTVDGLQNS